jgi:photoactive yellow protein
MDISFNESNLLHWLDTHNEDDFDKLSFGVVRMDYDGMVTAYSHVLPALAGVARPNAVSKHFFTQVGPCTNNFMVAEKYNAPVLDETLPYILTYITKPTPVQLRLLKGLQGNQYLVIKKA